MAFLLSMVQSKTRPIWIGGKTKRALCLALVYCIAMTCAAQELGHIISPIQVPLTAVSFDKQQRKVDYKGVLYDGDTLTTNLEPIDIKLTTGAIISIAPQSRLTLSTRQQVNQPTHHIDLQVGYLMASQSIQNRAQPNNQTNFKITTPLGQLIVDSALFNIGIRPKGLTTSLQTGEATLITPTDTMQLNINERYSSAHVKWESDTIIGLTNPTTQANTTTGHKKDNTDKQNPEWAELEMITAPKQTPIIPNSKIASHAWSRHNGINSNKKGLLEQQLLEYLNER